MYEFYNSSKETGQESFIERKYEEITKLEYMRYLNIIQGNSYSSLLFKIVNEIANHKLKEYILKYFYSEKYITTLYNLIVCEKYRKNFI